LVVVDRDVVLRSDLAQRTPERVGVASERNDIAIAIAAGVDTEEIEIEVAIDATVAEDESVGVSRRVV
jgi:hypothetical protein